MGKSRGAQERGNEEKQQPEFSRGRQPQKHRAGLAKEGLTLFLEKGRISTMGDSTVAGSHLHS